MLNASRDELKKLAELKALLRDVTPLPDEPDYFHNDETLIRYLRSRDLKMSDTEKMIRHSIEWRRQMKPLSVTCDTCLHHPGAHSFRMVGFDAYRRPVLYSSFNQASKVSVGHTDVNQHLIHTMENAVRAMVPGVNQWIIVFDCSGMSVSSCNPKLGHECTQLLSLHYPERLAHALCIRPGNAFKTALLAMKAFMPPVTAKKVHLIKYENDKQLNQSLQKYLDSELAEWLVKEVGLNGRKVITSSQRHFWSYNEEAEHDPRGTSEYVKEYIDAKNECGHEPHVNVTQAKDGKHLQWSRSKSEEVDAAEDDDDTSQSTMNHLEQNLDEIDGPPGKKGSSGGILSGLFSKK